MANGVGSVEEHADMLIDENLEKEIVRMAIQILFSHTQQNCTIGKLGQILHRRMNNPRLPRMFKHTYGGLKKFFERQNTIFEIKKDHLYNPIITLNKEFRDLVEDQMAKDRENQGRSGLLEKLSSPTNSKSEDKASSPRNNLVSRPPLTSSTSENLMNLASQGPVMQKEEKFTPIKTADWSVKVNKAQNAMAQSGEDSTWLDRLPRQLS